MADTVRLTTAHGVDLLMDAASVFGLLADLPTWPQLFEEVVHTELLEDEGTRQLGRIWSIAEGGPQAWTSCRRLDWERRSIAYERVEPVEPMAFTRGEWSVVDRGNGRCRVLLRQDFTTQLGTAAEYDHLLEQLGAAGVGQLHALRSSVHTGSGHADLQFELSATTVLPLADHPDPLGQLERTELWARLPRVRAAGARGGLGPWNAGGHRVTVLELDGEHADRPTDSRRLMLIALPEAAAAREAADGGETSTRELVFKELDPPSSVAAHTGRWSVRTISADKAVVTVRHVVTLDAVGVFAQFGADVTLTQARAQVRDAIQAENELLLNALRETVAGGDPGEVS